MTDRGRYITDCECIQWQVEVEILCVINDR